MVVSSTETVGTDLAVNRVGEHGDNDVALVLASASPRRQELLAQIGVTCRVLPVNIAEVRKEDETAEHYVQRLALEKAQAGWQLLQKMGQHPMALPVLGADTTVVPVVQNDILKNSVPQNTLFENALFETAPSETTVSQKMTAQGVVTTNCDEVFEKPKDKQDALRMLARLSGRSHVVMSAVAMVRGSEHLVLLNRTTVFFRDITANEMEAYWNSGEPMGKAGAYGIQGLGGIFVKKIEGSYSGVMGLPLWEVHQLLSRFKVPYWNKSYSPLAQ